MAQLATTALTLAASRFRAETGLPYTVAAVAEREGLPLPAIAEVHVQNVGFELIEKTAGAQYPRVQLYTEKITNSLREKFRTFSGTVRLVAEVRVSRDRIEEIERTLLYYVDAVTDVLDSQRGCWAPGVLYTGGYEVALQPLKHGGKNFLQSAKITFELEVSQG
jgi:hypothetical protein